MKAIQCPNCGSGSVQQLTEEKYFCKGCEQIFMVHNLSKEFRQTDEHISEMHSDLKREIGQMMENSANSEYNSLVEGAEYYMRIGDYEKAHESFTKITEKYPQYAVGWYGRYRALTKGFTEFENIDIVYGYISKEGKRHGFAGWEDVRNAMQCDDADREKITAEVTQYVRHHAERLKQGVEATLRGYGEKYAAVKRRQEELCPQSRKKATASGLMGLLPVLLGGSVLAVLVVYILAADIVGKIIGVVLIILALRFGGEWLLAGFLTLFDLGKVDSESERDALNQAAGEILGEEFEREGDKAYSSRHYITYRWGALCQPMLGMCVLLDAAYLLLRQTEDPDSFIRTYTTDPFDWSRIWQNEPEYELMTYCSMHFLQDENGHVQWDGKPWEEDAEYAARVEDFAANLMSGQIERFRYLLDGILVVPPAGKKASRAAAPADGVSQPGANVPAVGAPQSGANVPAVGAPQPGMAAAAGLGALVGSVAQGMESGLRSFKEGMSGKGMRGSQGAQGTQAQRFCPNCGASLAADAMFCGSCGTKIG